MRDVTERACRAFITGQNFKSKNTVVWNGDMFLFGNKIASRQEGKRIKISLCGHNTVTTRERLNGVLNYLHPRSPSIIQRQYEPYIVQGSMKKKIESTDVIELSGSGEIIDILPAKEVGW